MPAPVSRAAADPQAQSGALDRDQLIRAFRIMYMSRRIDDREILLKRQNRIYLPDQRRGPRGAFRRPRAWRCGPGHDWFYPYYRDRALSPDAGRDGRGACCCRRWARRPTRRRAAARCRRIGVRASLHIVSRLFAHRHAVPAGGRVRRRRRATWTPTRRTRSRWSPPAKAPPAKASSGKRVNVACLEKLPLLFLVEDNGCAISVPVEEQTPGGNISPLLEGFPGLFRVRVRRHGLSWRPTRAMREAAELLPRGQRTGLRARPRAPALFALALRRRAAVQDRRRARRRKPSAIPIVKFPAVADRRGRARPRTRCSA